VSLKNFPASIDVILGSNWDGTNGLNPTTQLTLHEVPFPNDGNWTEDGTLEPDESTNRLRFQPAQSGDQFTANIRAAWNYGDTTTPDVQWALAINVRATSQSGDYTFREAWLATGSTAYTLGSYFITGTPTYNPGIFTSIQGAGIVRTLDPVALTFTVPTPLIPQTATPDPVALAFTIPTPITAKTVAPAAGAITCTIPSVTTSKVFHITPDPITIAFTAPTPITAITQTVDPVVLAFTIPAVTPSKDVHPDPMVLAYGIAAVTPTFVPSQNIVTVTRAKPPARRRRPRPSYLSNPAAWRGKHYHDGRGLYRVFNSAAYRFYRSRYRPPKETDSPWATASSLPSTPADVFGDGTWYLSVSYYNGVLDSGFLPLGPAGETYVRLEIVDGAERSNPPAGPTHWRLEQRASGVIRVHAVYLQDPTAALRADQWAIGYTIDGSAPDTNDPDLTQAIGTDWLSILVYDLPGQANGTTVTVRLQTRRNDGSDVSPDWVYSIDSTTRQATADAVGPSTPLALEPWPGLIPDRA